MVHVMAVLTLVRGGGGVERQVIVYFTTDRVMLSHVRKRERESREKSLWWH